MSLRIYKKHVLSLFCMTVATFPAIAQTDSLFLTIDQLFERGVRHSLQIQADILKESIARERTHTARSAQLPDLQIGLKGGYVGQPILFEQGLAHPTRPEAPDWSQNYAIDLTQPIYQGGKIRYSIRKADLEKEVASLQTLTDQSEIKLSLLNQYIGLFSLFKQREVLSRNIEESERRLQDIRRMKKEGLITNNDVLRSEMQLTNDRLSLQETDNSLILVSQQLDILIGLDENLLLKPDTTLLDQTVSLETYEDYVAQAYSNDPAIRLLRKQTELAQNDIRLTKASSLPSLSLYASNTLARPVSRTLADMYNNNWNIGLSLSYPLSSLYKNNHKIKESKWMVSLHKNEEEQKKQKIRIEVRTAFLRHKEALQEVEALKLSRTASSRELQDHAKPVFKPIGDPNRLTRRELGSPQRGATAHEYPYPRDLHLLSTTEGLRPSLKRNNDYGKRIKRETSKTKESKDTEYSIKLHMYPFSRFRHLVDSQLFLALHQL